MATKENITFQRGMLKSIQTRVTTLASILLSFELFVLLYFSSVEIKMSVFFLCTVDLQKWLHLCRSNHSMEQDHTASLTVKAGMADSRLHH